MSEHREIAGVRSNMDRLFLVVTFALSGCVRTVAPDPLSSEPLSQPPTPPAASEPVETSRECLGQDLFRSLEACTFAGVNELQLPRLSAAPIADLWARAEEHWRAERWPECAELFADLSERHPEREKRAEASYVAVLCVNNEHEQVMTVTAEDERRSRAPGRRRGRKVGRGERERLEQERLRPRELTDRENRMIATHARHECLAPESENLVQVKYRRARIHYTANQWEIAAVLFRDIVTRHPEDDLAPFAANQYLDCLNVIARLETSRRESCRERLYQDVEAFLGDEELMRDAAFRDQLTRLQCAMIWRRAERAQESEQLHEAARLYLRIYRDHREGCADFGNGRGLDEVLYNAAVILEAGDLLCQAMRVRERLVSAYGEGSEHSRIFGRASPWAARALYQLGENHRELGNYSESIGYFEDFAERYPGEERSSEAARIAGLLRSSEQAASNQEVTSCESSSSELDLGPPH